MEVKLSLMSVCAAFTRACVPLCTSYTTVLMRVLAVCWVKRDACERSTCSNMSRRIFRVAWLLAQESA